MSRMGLRLLIHARMGLGNSRSLPALSGILQIALNVPQMSGWASVATMHKFLGGLFKETFSAVRLKAARE
jgi:hypothetical protein